MQVGPLVLQATMLQPHQAQRAGFACHKCHRKRCHLQSLWVVESWSKTILCTSEMCIYLAMITRRSNVQAFPGKSQPPRAFLRCKLPRKMLSCFSQAQHIVRSASFKVTHSRKSRREQLTTVQDAGFCREAARQPAQRKLPTSSSE